MGITAELVADKYKVSREDQDVFAAASHVKAAAAIEQGKFKEEIIPVEVENCALVNGKMKKEKEVVSIDDGVRGDTTAGNPRKTEARLQE